MVAGREWWWLTGYRLQVVSGGKRGCKGAAFCRRQAHAKWPVTGTAGWWYHSHTCNTKLAVTLAERVCRMVQEITHTHLDNLKHLHALPHFLCSFISYFFFFLQIVYLFPRIKFTKIYFFRHQRLSLYGFYYQNCYCYSFYIFKMLNSLTFILS